MASGNPNPNTPNPPSTSSIYLTNMEEVKKVFNRFDTNKDGKISSEELTNIMKSVGSTTSAEEIKEMMKNIDTDKDGFINLEEFACFCKEGKTEDEDMELQEAFELYDLNKNGLISSTELHQILNKLGEMCSLDDCVNMINSVDSDGDGFVNFQEFKNMMSNGAADGGAT